MSKDRIVPNYKAPEPLVFGTKNKSKRNDISFLLAKGSLVGSNFNQRVVSDNLTGGCES